MYLFSRGKACVSRVFASLKRTRNRDEEQEKKSKERKNERKKRRIDIKFI